MQTAALRDLLAAVHFAADKHRDQRRKDAGASPYVNHPIEVAETLARVGAVGDAVALQAALLHDTLEDTLTTPAELEQAFGREVRAVVEEVTDDKALPKAERKRRQIEHARALSPRAKLVKLADKICNVRDVIHDPPATWSRERRRQYLEWAAAVVDGCRGVNDALETCFDELLQEGRRALDDGPAD